MTYGTIGILPLSVQWFILLATVFYGDSLQLSSATSSP
ncbi:hypothetical protein EVA_03463 [gut metagenome]|uniref:Secreted protein n=1 Tax=gut metagenome TaxID=749906 RepID=J9GYW8_9ZZZZ